MKDKSCIFTKVFLTKKNEVPKNVLPSWDDFREISPSQLGRHDCNYKLQHRDSKHSELVA